MHLSAIARRATGLASLAGWLLTAAGCSADAGSVKERGGKCATVSRSGTRAIVSNVNITHGDIAFRVGCDGEFWLAIVDPGLRGQVQSRGRLEGDAYPEDRPDREPHVPRTFSGSILPAPYPEARYSWCLTRSEQHLLTTRQEYIRLRSVAE